MSDITPSPTGAALTLLPEVVVPQASIERKALDLAVVKRGAKDYLEFLDATKEVFYGYVYHCTGSAELSRTIVEETYVDVLTRAMSLLWMGRLSLKLLLDAADEAVKGRETVGADIDKVYAESLAWVAPNEQKSVLTLHDTLWSLPKEGQRLIILSMLLGLSDERMAQVLGKKKEAMAQDLATARQLFLDRWQPAAEVMGKLGSLVFAPALSLQAETKLRFSVVEKYNGLRFRRYQWVIVGGLFAVLSNVIVASVLAFAVISVPPTSLKGVRSQLTSLDAVLLKRQLTVDSAKNSIAVSFKESQKLAAYAVSRNFTNLGLASALEALKAEQDQEAEVERILKLMERARTAMMERALPETGAVKKKEELA